MRIILKISIHSNDVFSFGFSESDLITSGLSHLFWRVYYANKLIYKTILIQNGFRIICRTIIDKNNFNRMRYSLNYSIQFFHELREGTGFVAYRNNH